MKTFSAEDTASELVTLSCWYRQKWLASACPIMRELKSSCCSNKREIGSGTDSQVATVIAEQFS
jgi:hypothetical protein